MPNQLDLLSFLCDHRHTDISALTRHFGCARCTIQRDLDKLVNHRFIIERGYNKVVFRAWSPLYNDFFHPVFVNVQQRELLLHLVRGLSDSNPEKSHLLSALKNSDDAVAVPRLFFDPQIEPKLRAIDYAMNHKKQVVINQYRSRSGELKTHIVEPVAWSDEYRQCAVYDKQRGKMITMVVGRMGSVTLTNDRWEFESLHKTICYDCFWMSGEIKEEVTLELSQLALNLLHEDYSSSREYKAGSSGDTLRPFNITMPIRQLEGCARFVMGMGTHCIVRQGIRLQEYIYGELLQVHAFYHNLLSQKQIL